MTDYDRPFDALSELEDEQIEVHRQDGTYATGKLVAWDKHLNLILVDARVYDGDERDYPFFVQRGGAITDIRPRLEVE